MWSKLTSSTRLAQFATRNVAMNANHIAALHSVTRGLGRLPTKQHLQAVTPLKTTIADMKKMPLDNVECRREFVTKMCHTWFGIPKTTEQTKQNETSKVAIASVVAGSTASIASAAVTSSNDAAHAANAGNSAVNAGVAAESLQNPVLSSTESLVDAATAAATTMPPDAPGWFSRTFGLTELAWEAPGTIVGTMIDIIDSFHTFTGLPWWAAIVSFSIGIRLLTLPMMFMQTKGAAKLQQINPQLTQFRKELDNPNLSAAERQALMLDMQALLVSHGVSPIKSLLLGLASIPIFIIMFLALRNLALHPQYIEALSTGGLGPWLDLTKADPTYGLALTVGLSNFALLELNFRDQRQTGQVNAFAKIMQRTFRVMTIAFIPFIAQFPTALFCFWLPSNLVTITWTLFIRNNAIRKLVGIPPRIIAKQASTASAKVASAPAAQAVTAGFKPSVSRPLQMYKGAMPKSFKKPSDKN